MQRYTGTDLRPNGHIYVRPDHAEMQRQTGTDMRPGGHTYSPQPLSDYSPMYNTTDIYTGPVQLPDSIKNAPILEDCNPAPSLISRGLHLDTLA